MKIYLRADPSNETVTHSIADTLTKISSLNRQGFLPMDATVWINGDYPDLGMWVLAERSSHVRVHRTITPGWVRLTRTQARIAATIDATSAAPSATYSINDVPGSDDVRSTLIIAHSSSSDKVRVVANSAVVNFEGGAYSYDPWTVVDLNAYAAPENATTNPVQCAHAMLNGVKLMTFGFSDDARQMVADHIEDFSFDFAEKDRNFFDQIDSRVTDYAKFRADEILSHIATSSLVFPPLQEVGT